MLMSFQWETYVKIVSEKSMMRPVPVILYQQAWLGDGLSGDGQLLLL